MFTQFWAAGIDGIFVHSVYVLHSTKGNLCFPWCYQQERNAFRFHGCLASKSRLHIHYLPHFCWAQFPKRLQYLLLPPSAQLAAIRYSWVSSHWTHIVLQHFSPPAQPTDSFPAPCADFLVNILRSLSLFSRRPISIIQCVWNTFWGPEWRHWLIAPLQR